MRMPGRLSQPPSRMVLPSSIGPVVTLSCEPDQQAGGGEPLDHLASDRVGWCGPEDGGSDVAIGLAAGEKLAPFEQLIQRAKTLHVRVEVDAAEAMHHLVPSEVRLLRVRNSPVEQPLVAEPRQVLEAPDPEFPIGMVVDRRSPCGPHLVGHLIAAHPDMVEDARDAHVSSLSWRRQSGRRFSPDCSDRVTSQRPPDAPGLPAHERHRRLQALTCWAPVQSPGRREKAERRCLPCRGWHQLDAPASGTRIEEGMTGNPRRERILPSRKQRRTTSDTASI